MKINRSRFFVLSVVIFNSLFAGCKITENHKVHPPALVIKPPPQREKMEELLVPMIEDKKGPERLLTFSLRDADIGETLLSFSKVAGCNIVLDPDVSGKITVDVRRLTLSEALDAILTPLKLQYKKDRNFVRVSKSRPETRIFRLNYINTKRMGSSNLTTFLNISSGGGGISGGGISSTDMTDFWDETEKGLKGLLSEEGKMTTNKASGTILVADYPPNLKKVAAYLEEVDGSIQRQVMIQAKVVSIDLSDEYQMGIDWSSVIKIFGLKGSLSGNKMISQALGANTGIFQIGFLSDGDFSLLFDAMASQGKVNVLSSPKISALNNQKAAIKVVRSDVFFEVRTDIAATTGVTTTSTTSKIVDVGVVLEVTPQISGNGQIIMSIHPIITEKVDDATFKSDKITLTVPVLTVREAGTVVRIADGQTMIIAGLIQDKSDIKETKIPFLGDIPVFNFFFKKTKKSGQRNELAIFLTPTVLMGKNIEDFTQEELENIHLLGG